MRAGLAERVQTAPSPLEAEPLGVAEALPGPVSPELVLVCPELARVARRQLPEPGEVYCGRYPAAAAPIPLPTDRALPLRRVPEDVRAGKLRLEPAVAPISDEPPPPDEISATLPRRFRLRPFLIPAVVVAALLAIPELGILSRGGRPTLTSTATSELPAEAATPATGSSLPRPPQVARRRSDTETAPPQPAETIPPAALPIPRELMQDLRWPSRAGATYYNVQVFRDAKKIFEVWPPTAQATVPGRWTYQGNRYRLSSGSYEWFVWPGFGARSETRYGKLIKRATFVVTEQPG